MHEANQQTQPSTISAEEVARAAAQEINDVRQRVYALETKIAKYERVFEQLFREELDSRIGAKRGGYGECGQLQANPLSDMQWRLEKAAAMQAGVIGGRGL